MTALARRPRGALLRFYLERLADADDRAAMLDHWRQALAWVADLVSPAQPGTDVVARR